MVDMRPRRRTAGSLQQLRYQVPYDIAASAVYPLTSTNGSSVVLCGHSHGLFIIWRGGRQLKSTKQKAAAKATPAQDVMTIDDSGDERPTAETLTPPEFEEEEEEFDPRTPYPPIVQTLDIPLGTGVLQLAVPQLSDAEKRHLKPKLLRKDMLVVVGCADSSVRVLTIPLTPPSETSKLRKSLVQNPSLAVAGHGNWGERIVEVPKGLGHRTLPAAVSIAAAPRHLFVDSEDEDMDNSQDQHDGWDILLASGSADVGGTLLVHRIPVEVDGLRLAEEGVETWRSVLLEAPPTALDLHVGLDIAATASPRVLVAEANRACRVYELMSGESRYEGEWLATLRTSSRSNPRLLSVKFGLAGRLSLALTEEGEWGVWDLADLPDPHEKTTITLKGTVPTLKRFGYSNTLASTTLMSSAQSTVHAPSHNQALHAVTPHTRKVRQQALFSGNASRPNQGGSSIIGPQNGAITLTKTTHESGTGEDFSLLIWYGDRVTYVQSLRAHHASRRARSGAESSSSSLIAADDPFNVVSSAGAQAKQLTVPDRNSLNGGSQITVYPLLHIHSRGLSVRNKAPEAVYISERAVSFVGMSRNDDAETKVPNGDAAGARPIPGPGIGGLLKAGELSLEGVEGMLDRMAGGVKRLSGMA